MTARKPNELLTVAVDLPETADWSDTAGVIEGGVAFCAQPNQACFLPARLLPAAKSVLEDSAIPKRVHDLKSALRRLADAGITLAGVADDTLLAAFLVDSSRADYSLDKIIARHLAASLDGSLARTVDLNRRLGEMLAQEIDARALRQVYENIELPFAPILARMEQTGVLIDSGILAALSNELESRIATLSQEIYDLAGVSFNINSPKQLGEILFDKLQLPKPGKRGKTKVPSTASDVLEALAPAHTIAAKVLEHRQLMKLKGTYVDALPALVDPATGRLHTTFNQAGAATGRISSSNPNLQNIPIRTELGREVRAAFISRPGWNLLAADYSQIELRILAHISGDPVLTDAFRRGEDIHTRTAAEVFGVPPLMIGPEERRRAKAVNFGIAYGLSPFGLSQQLGIPMGDARQYIDAYFKRYAGVKKYMDDAIQQARDTGYTKTLVGRLRPIHDLDSKNPAARGFAERTAINSPIQGSAADIIKLAMIRVDQRLREQGGQALMLLQVHDELLFEVPEDETAAVADMVKREMEQAYALKVPLIADVKAGKNWRDLTPRE
jgi:DNA polymerase-1